MREILFRGKSKINGEWVYGFYSGENCSEIFSPMFKQDNIIIKGSGFWVEVEAETVGEYTGLTDGNCVRIFEGDIVENIETGMRALVQYFKEHAAFMLWCRSETVNQIEYVGEISFFEVQVIGNIHDNPELLGDNDT